MLLNKSYLSSVEFSADEGILRGKIIGINDLVSYGANSIDDLQKVFIEAVEDYPETCKELNKEPNKYYKGVFNVSLDSTDKRNSLLLKKALSGDLVLGPDLRRGRRKNFIPLGSL
ncbi:type II toxin-antitoxin system HicB family antitoxin, partial [Maribacter sp. 2307ULW6-5]|uniref:type II toxin-antitoxin system HicB family antitoxin n=1 Tax=Maribacter sp. 2307ULW6-5 TaxID=3386275 RepID=UPI0039BCBF45